MAAGRRAGNPRGFSASLWPRCSGRIEKLEIKNRLVRSAAYENGGDAAAEGEVTEDYIRIHRAYAEGGIGMTLTCYMAVMEHGNSSPVQVSAIPGLRRLTEAVHGVGNDCRSVPR